MTLTLTDLFAGAGGSSTGATQIPGVDYKWRGTRREQFRLSGNAVTPPAARDIVSTIAETLAA